MKILTLLFSVLVLCLCNTNAIADTLLLQGSISQILNLTVTPSPIANNLDLSTSQNNLIVASINEQSNSKTGYTVNITSLNRGKLKRTNGTTSISYTAKYNGNSISIYNSSGTILSYPTSSAVNINKNLTISYTGTDPATLIEGTYVDTVTFIISAI